ncbi:MAG: sigma-54-dependent transcriptional regulator [Vicinamibacteria bacterium]
MTTRATVLLVDDEAGIRLGIRRFLEANGYRVEEAASCREAEKAFSGLAPDAAILDLQLPDGSGVDLVPRLKGIAPEVPLVLLSAYGSIETAVTAIKHGADHFLTKPVELPALLILLKRLLESRRDQRTRLAGTSRQAREGIDPFLGTSPAVRQLADETRRICAADAPVLIHGETGSGKGVLARWIHEQSPRAADPLVDLNCAALSRELLDSELFGHEKGAFTGATSSKMGLLEVAHGGTVFLDEIGDMDPAVQPKLLKALEDKRIRRLGEVRDRHVDLRLIAATHQDLERLVREGKFRSDLYYRINTIVLVVPPLRQRREDIALLARHLLEKGSREMGRGSVALSADAMRALEAHSWPGNVRELRNVLERALLVCERGAIEVRDLRFAIGGSPEPGGGEAPQTLEEIERRAIEDAVRAEGGNLEAAAKRLGISRSGIYLKMRKYGLAPLSKGSTD